MPGPTPSWRIMAELAKAVGYGGVPLQKLVIECDIKDVVRVYAKGLARLPDPSALSDAFRVIAVDAVSVSDDCTVTFQPQE